LFSICGALFCWREGDLGERQLFSICLVLICYESSDLFVFVIFDVLFSICGALFCWRETREILGDILICLVLISDLVLILREILQTLFSSVGMGRDERERT
jgi:hypothetical protein